MISFTAAELSALIAGFLWPFARVAALVAAAPVLGNVGVPRRVKLLLAIGVTAAVAPLAGPLPPVEPWSASGLAILVRQMMIGAAMGLTVRLVFAMIDVAGEVTGLQMGLGFATFFDPQHRTQSPVVPQFLGLLAALVFLGINGHLMLLAALAESFHALPLGSDGFGAPAWQALAEAGSRMFASGLLLALPAVVALLISNVALGILTRAAPQLNLFAVGFPVTILVGWLVLALSLPALAPFFTHAFEDALRMMLQPLGSPSRG